MDHFQVHLYLHVKDSRQFQIKIEGLHRDFLFKAENLQQAEKWLKNITVQVKMSQGFENNLNAKGLKKPWRFDNMSEQQFLAKADTGDILLFRSTNGVSKMTRGLTKSHFDHVAMILKFETDPREVYFIESTGNAGVALNRWLFLRKHIGKDKFYDKVVFRHI